MNIHTLYRDTHGFFDTIFDAFHDRIRHRFDTQTVLDDQIYLEADAIFFRLHEDANIGFFLEEARNRFSRIRGRQADYAVRLQGSIAGNSFDCLREDEDAALLGVLSCNKNPLSPLKILDSFSVLWYYNHLRVQ